jgi:hypothetical protein
VQEEIIHVHGVCHRDKKSGKSIEQPGALSGHGQIYGEEICPGLHGRGPGPAGGKDADVGVTNIMGIGRDSNREAGMQYVEHLSFEKAFGTIIQDKFIDESQSGSKVGNLPANPPDTHYRKPRHFSSRSRYAAPEFK